MKKEQTQKKTHNKIGQEIKSWIFIILIALGLKTAVVASYIVPTPSMENTIMTGDFLLGNQFLYGVRTPDWIGIPYTDIGFHIPYFRLPQIKKPQPGEIIIFKFPGDRRTNYVKRCVAGPGQTLKIKNRVLYVDDMIFENPEYLKHTRNRFYPANVDNPHIFPQGDGNEDNFRSLYVPEKGDTLWFGKVPAEMLKDIVELARHSLTIKDNQMYIDGIKSDYYVVEQNQYFMMGDNRDNSYDSRFWGYVPEDLIIGKALVVFMSWDKNAPLYKKIRWQRIGNLIN